MSAGHGTMGNSRRLHPLVAGAAVTVMVFSALGVAAITGVLPGAMSQKGADVAPGPVGSKAVLCPSCGTIESIRPVEVRGEGTGVGAVAGGVTGAAAGQQHVVYRITVRMDDGLFRTVSQASAPTLAVGDKVRVVQGALHAAKPQGAPENRLTRPVE
jgi:outer membrane lipoprotein SlyB